MTATEYVAELLLHARGFKREHPLSDWNRCLLMSQAALGREGQIGYAIRLLENDEREYLVRYLERQEAGTHG